MNFFFGGVVFGWFELVEDVDVFFDSEFILEYVFLRSDIEIVGVVNGDFFVGGFVDISDGVEGCRFVIVVGVEKGDDLVVIDWEGEFVDCDDWWFGFGDEWE